ncbi:MAG: hypothetical protein CVU88_08735, partial [Firmicutes bacterium HGW-Firmicutes-13]
MKWFNTFLDLVYPPRCLLCRRLMQKGEIVCSSCRQNIVQEAEGCPICLYPINRGDKCARCGGREFYLNGIYGLGPYRGELKELIHKYKYE